MNCSSVVVGVAAFLAIANPCVAAQPGSVDAAKLLVPEVLGRLYAIIETPTVVGDTATVKATLLDLHCNLKLVRNMTANSSGWVVATADCKKP